MQRGEGGGHVRRRSRGPWGAFHGFSPADRDPGAALGAGPADPLRGNRADAGGPGRGTPAPGPHRRGVHHRRQRRWCTDRVPVRSGGSRSDRRVGTRAAPHGGRVRTIRRHGRRARPHTRRSVPPVPAGRPARRDHLPRPVQRRPGRSVPKGGGRRLGDRHFSLPGVAGTERHPHRRSDSPWPRSGSIPLLGPGGGPPGLYRAHGRRKGRALGHRCRPAAGGPPAHRRQDEGAGRAPLLRGDGGAHARRRDRVRR